MASPLPGGFVLEEEPDISALPEGFEIEPEPETSRLAEFGSRVARGVQTGVQDVAGGFRQLVADTFRGFKNPYLESTTQQATDDIPKLETQIANRRKLYDANYPQGQTFQQLAEAGNQDPIGSTQRLLEINRLEKQLAQAREASQGRVAEPFGGSIARASEDLVQEGAEKKEEIEKKFSDSISPYRNEEFWMKVADSLGQSAPSTGATILNTPLGLSMMFAQSFQGARDEYVKSREMEGKPVNEDEAASYAVEQATIQTPFEVVGDVALAGTIARSLGGIFKQGASPSKIVEWIKDRGIDLAKSMAGETIITTPGQSISEDVIAEREGVRAPTTAGEKIGKAVEQAKVAAAQSLLMGGGPIAAEGITKAVRGAFSESEKGVIKQAARQVENLDANNASITARTFEQLTADQLADSRINFEESSPEEQMDRAAEILSEISAPDEFAPPQQEVSLAVEQPRTEAEEQPISEQDAAKARVEEALLVGQEPNPADVELAGAAIASAQLPIEDAIQESPAGEIVLREQGIQGEGGLQGVVEQDQPQGPSEEIQQEEVANASTELVPSLPEGEAGTPESAPADQRATQESVTQFAEGQAIPAQSEPQGSAGTGQSSPKRVQLRSGPQSFEVLEKIPQTEIEKQNNEQFWRVRNERTGEIQEVETGDFAREIKPKSERVKKAVQRLPKNQQAKAEAATTEDTSDDPYQGVPLSTSSPLELDENLRMLEDLSRSGVLDEGANARTVLEKIRDNKKTPDWQKRLAQRLLEAGMEDIAVMAAYRPSSTWAGLFTGPEILFNLARRSPGVTETVLHEAAHKLTLAQLRNPGNLKGEAAKAYKELQDIFSKIKDRPEFRGQYGLTNVEEMVAEAFSNAGFRAKLDRIQSGPKTLWQKFINAITRLLFNKSAAYDSLLHQIVENAFTLGGAPIVESRSNGTAAMAEPDNWEDAVGNPNASTEAEAKGYVQMGEELADETDLTTEDVKPLTPAQRELLMPTETFSPIGLANYWAKQFSNIRGTDHNERVSEAITGMVKAAKTFNPESGVPFFQWANRVIKGQMTNFARSRKIRGTYVQPDRPVLEDDDTETLVSTYPTPEDVTVQENDRKRMMGVARDALQGIINQSTPKEKQILLEYAKGGSLRDVAAKAGMSQEGVRKFLLRYRNRVEQALGDRGITDIREILDQPTETYEQAIPTRRRGPFDEESADREVTGELEGKAIEAQTPTLGEDIEGLPGPTEGLGFDSSEQEGVDFFRYTDRSRTSEAGAYQSAPLEAQLRNTLEKRPELSPVLSKFGIFLSRFGGTFSLWTQGRFKAAMLADGTPFIALDPNVLATEPLDYIESALEEEAIHVLDNLINLPEFQATGAPMHQFDVWAANKSSQMLDEFMDAATQLPKDQAQAVADAMVGAYNAYHLGVDGYSVSNPADLVRILNNSGEQKFLNKHGFLHEFARMLVQQERSGRITEETARTFLEKIVDFIRKGIDSIKRVSGLIQEQGLKNTRLGRLTNDLIALADENLPPKNSVAPMAEFQRGGEDITNPRGPIDQGNVAPLSERGRKTRTPILRVTEGPYKPEGILRAAGKWSQDLYKLLRGKEQKTRAAISRMQFVDKAFQKELKKTFTNNGIRIPQEVINTALGNTDNRLTQAQAAEARTIRDPEARRAFVEEAKLQNLEEFKVKQADALESLPENIQKGVTEMRELIDNLSRELIKEGDISPDLKGTIDQNVGTYLHRSYAIFDGDEWADFITSNDPDATKIRNRAESLFADYIRAQKAREYAAQIRAEGGSISPKAALEAVKDLNITAEVGTMLADYLAVADGSVVDTLRGRLPGQKNQSILKIRGDIPKEIRDLWGQYDNASLNFAKTYASIATFLENNRFLRGVLADGLQNGYLWKDGVSQGPRPADYVEIVGGEGSKSMAPLAGTYGPPVLRDAFQEYVNPRVQDWLGTLTTAAMKAKTVYSIGSIVRNFIGNPGFMLANGNVFTGDLGNAAQLAWANLTKSGQKEFREKVSKMYELGVFGENIGPQVIKELAERAKKLSSAKTPAQGLLKSMGEKLEGVRKGFEGVYSGVDDFWKVYAFDSELNKLKWANPETPIEELEQRAADIVRSTVPTYSESPQIVRNLFKGQVGRFVAPFITFTTEVIRVTYGAARRTAIELQSSNPRERAIGAARLAGLMAIASLPGIIEEATKGWFGYDDDDEEALRSGLPDWQKNATLLFLPPDANGNIRFVDLSYLNPYNYFTDTIKAITRGVANGNTPTEVGQQALWGATGQILAPFISEQIAFGAYADVIRNQKANGTDVYNPQDTPENIAKNVGWRLAQPFIPGTADSAIRIYKAAKGEVNPAGKQYDLLNEIMSPVLGQRISTNDRNQVFQFQVGRFNGTRTDAAKLFSEIFSNKGTVQPGQVADAYRRANQARYRIYQELRDNYLGSLALGMSRKEAVDTMKAKGAGEDAINQVLSGTYWRYEPSPQSIRNVREEFPERVREFQQAFQNTPARIAFQD